MKLPSADVMRGTVDTFYEQAVAYQNLGNASQARANAYLAAQFSGVAKRQCRYVSKNVSGEIAFIYRTSGAQAEHTPIKIVDPFAQDAHNLRAWARQYGFSGDEIDIIGQNGKPCHQESYHHGDNYHQLTLWFCDDGGHYREAYAFLNGKLQSHYVP